MSRARDSYGRVVMTTRRDVRKAWLRYRLMQAGVVGAAFVTALFVLTNLGWLGK